MAATTAGTELLETLDATACLRLLRATRVGRLAVVVDGRPHIVVLNHLELAGDVFFRTSEDSLAARLTAGDAIPASYEVDSAFPAGRTGWSVIADGELDRVRDAAAVERVAAALEPWAGGERDAVLRLSARAMTGRYVGPA